MARYDRERGYGREYRGRGRRLGYDPDFGYGRAWSDRPGGGAGPYWSWGQAAGHYGPRYDRGIYGESYPEYGGYPGGPQRGMYYGAEHLMEQDAAAGPRRPPRWSAPATRYDQRYAREAFLPESAYRRHPEMERASEHLQGSWPVHGHAPSFGPVDDPEIRHGVQENLHRDGWLRAEDIQVDVSNGVVTLRGEVEDYMQARYAWDDAWDSRGVRGVVNQLTVRTDRPQSPHGDVLPQREGSRRGAGEGVGEA